MRSRLAEGGALAMRLSLVSLNAARRGAAFFVAVEAKIKVSLPSPNGSVDQRKSPSWHARIGSLVQRRQSPLWIFCHEYCRSTRRCATVREMKEGPSRSAI